VSESHVSIPHTAVVIVALQLVVFSMFGWANEYVLHRLEYQVRLCGVVWWWRVTIAWLICIQAGCGFVAAVVGTLLWRIWRTDVLVERSRMLLVAAQFDMISVLMVGGMSLSFACC
jgi:hypothetical protein